MGSGSVSLPRAAVTIVRAAPAGIGWVLGRFLEVLEKLQEFFRESPSDVMLYPVVNITNYLGMRTRPSVYRFPPLLGATAPIKFWRN